MKVKLVIVGMGAVTQRSHLPALKHLKNYEIIGFYEPNAELANSFKDKYKGCATLEELFDLQPDLVLIATPSAYHASIAIQAIKRGINCLVEKPLALQLDEAIQIKEAMKGTSVKVYTGLHFRHSFQVQKLKAIIDSEKFGKVVGFQGVFTNHVNRRKTVSGYEKKRNSGGGVLYDLAYHHADLFSYLLHQKATKVSARIDSKLFDDDTAFATFTFGDICGSGFYSSITYNEHTLKVFFEKAIVEVDFYKSPDLLIIGGSNSILDKLKAELFQIGSMLKLAFNLFPKFKTHPFIQQYTLIAKSLNGESNQMASLEDGIHALSIIESIYTSNNSNSWETVK
jgi:predicted dehydrogenase